MIDLHAHILPEMDDGSQSLDESLHMAHMALRSGVDTVVATPHSIDGGAGAVRKAVEYLRYALRESGIDLRLCAGMEIFGTRDTARLLRSGELLTLNGSRYPLIEFSFDGDGMEQTAVLQSVLAAGYQPVVAHPERYSYVQTEPEIINEWVRMGCLLQINRGSLQGRFGGSSREMALQLVGRGFASVVASDAHGAQMRTTWMYDAWDLLAKGFAPIVAQTLMIENPRKILNDETIRSGRPEWF